MEDWKKLSKVHQINLKHKDGWGYKCTGYSDVIEIRYIENTTSDSVREFSVPTAFAKQVFTELAKLAEEAEKLEDF